MLLAFVIAHVYLTTTGDKPFTSIKAMLTGWEVIDIDEKEERMKHLSEAVNDSSAGYYRIDKEGKIVDVNIAWLRMYKCQDSHQVIGKHFSVTRDEKNQQDLKKIVDSSAGYYRLDSQGTIIDVNEAWLKLYKYEHREEIIGNHYSITRKPIELDKLNDLFSKVMRGEIVSSRPVSRLCRDGSDGRHIVSANPVYLGNKISGMEGFILDITNLEDN